MQDTPSQRQVTRTCLFSSRRIRYATVLLLIVALGLLSRKVPVVPAGTGDALWAVMVFCGWRILFPHRKLSQIALLALLTSYLDEFSQLLSWPWLAHLRSTTLGHLILGQGFLWTDLLAYALGILVTYLIARWCESQRTL